jgi:SAM-dependent methyltransferase
MINLKKNYNIDFDAIDIDPFWNTGEEKELKMHRIHAYPAKFPAFITTNALNYAKQHSVNVNSIADIFCGCGTTAFEAKRNGIKFWGCDISPVATMIAIVKSKKYQTARLKKYLETIIEKFTTLKTANNYDNANSRLKYWYKEKEYNDLNRLKQSIKKSVPKKSKYKLFFLCAFSNILKPTSIWLTKSIKPHVDPDKKPAEVIVAFKKQSEFMISANDENRLNNKYDPVIITGNFLDDKVKPKNNIDMIITSPPYATSYEYADLHQLSSLWLDYVEDYRELRNGSIGSLYHINNRNKKTSKLNYVGDKIISTLSKRDKLKAKSVAKYFIDMQAVAQKSYNILNKGGIALFVVGNTEYKGVHIDNVKHLAKSLKDAGFPEISATKRKISNKILTPYRDKQGKFTNNVNGRKIYSQEFILIGKK